MLTVIVLTDAIAQGVNGKAVKVKSTVPAPISVAEGI